MKKFEQRLAGAGPGRVAAQQRRGAQVVGLHHAAAAEGLDTLVVAVHRAARVVDVDQHAGRGLHAHHGRVDVADVMQAGLDHDAAGREHLDHGVVAEDEARKVEVMDGHVAEMPPDVLR